MRKSAKIAAILLLPIALSACAGSDEGKPITYTDDRGVSNQPFPNNYRAEVLAFMKTYLNNPVGVRDAVMAEPVQRVVGGRLRYVVCLRFSRARIRRRLSRAARTRHLFVEAGSTVSSKTPVEPCAGAVYAPFRNWKR